MREVVDAVAARAGNLWGSGGVERADVVWRLHRDDRDLSPFSRGAGVGEPITPARSAPAIAAESARPGTSVRLLGRLAEAGVSGGIRIEERKPEWMRARVQVGDRVLALRRTVRDLDLVTVCEEAGCPNLSECWSEGTATFMLCGERCTRACGFCLVDTRHPEPLDPGEPDRVAAAVDGMGLDYAVLTMVARDDLADGGAAHVAATIRAIRRRCPETRIEALISDLAGEPDSLDVVLGAGPDVLNHNIETVARLQRAVRPSAAYARSLAVLARSAATGVSTKSGIVVGMGETSEEVVATLADLRSVGVDIVTIGHYLRPTTHHLPVERWWTPADFDEWKRIGEQELGIAHVESSPLTRSSHHARAAEQSARSAGNAQATGVRSTDVLQGLEG
jgi:lipoic acid synthetase